jgi:hypothetical protein
MKYKNITLGVLVFGLIVSLKLVLPNTSRALSLPSDFSFTMGGVCEGITQHVKYISNKACPHPTTDPLTLSVSSSAEFNVPGTCEYGHLYVVGPARTTLWYYGGPNLPGVGGHSLLKKQAGCWEVTIGNLTPEYVTITN